MNDFTLGPGDVILVDTGVYNLTTNILLGQGNPGAGQDDAGAPGYPLVIQGPTDPGKEALLDRGNTSTGSYIFELLDADYVPFDTLSITGAQYGVHAPASSDSDGVTVSNSHVFGNSSYGIYTLSGSDGALISNNVLHDNGSYGIRLVSTAGAVVTNNEVYGNTTGINVSGTGLIFVNDNHVYDNSTGISVSSGSAAVDLLEVRSNTVHDNTSTGINASGSRYLIVQNTVFHQDGTNDIGISASSGEIRQNGVHSNYDGISTSSSAEIFENRAYNNTNARIRVSTAETIWGNQVYSNSIGILAVGSPWFTGDIINNLVYANSNQGILIQRGLSGAFVANNTVFQEVGDAVRVESFSQDVRLANNILWVEAGRDIFVDPNSQTQFESDYNVLHQGVDPAAKVGHWGGVDRDSLADWQAATGQDAGSLAADPLFVDPNGADNTLGYSTAGLGFDGGPDDNFKLAAGSPAIDQADSWSAPLVDKDGFPRFDDPGTPNLGTVDYFEGTTADTVFGGAPVGIAQNWRSDNNSWNYNFAGGFTFDYYGQTYTQVRVGSNGCLQFGSSSGASDSTNSLEELIEKVRIAPLWDDLTTAGTADNIFVDTTMADRVTFRWDATNVADGSDVNFAVTLLDTGAIRFDYGPGNTNLTPTVGISAGDGINYVVSAYDGRFDLENESSIQFDLLAGFADMGAYEFTGSSLDVTPTTIISTDPADIDAATMSGELIDQIVITFSESLNSIDANAPANYELRDAGPNMSLGDGDDTIYTLTPSYVTGAFQVTLTIGEGVLPPQQYELTVFGDTTIHDLAGLALDGDGDGLPGGNYVRSFESVAAGITVTPTAGLVTTEAGGTAQFSIVLDREPTDDVTIDLTSTLPGEGQPDVSSLTFTPANWDEAQIVTIVNGDDFLIWQIAFGSALPALGTGSRPAMSPSKPQPTRRWLPAAELRQDATATTTVSDKSFAIDRVHELSFRRYERRQHHISALDSENLAAKPIDAALKSLFGRSSRRPLK